MKKQKGKRKSDRLEVVYHKCAGIDVGKDKNYVAVDPDRPGETVCSFSTMTPGLREMTDWLRKNEVERVAMESTGVYWIPAYEVLESAGFEVMLVPPRMTRQISGRKSDVLDCQWIRQLFSHGLLRGAFRPDDEICPVRSMLRQRQQLVDDRVRCVHRIQKALTQMNVRLDSAISDIMGKSGRAILGAIVEGERDPRRLAALRDRRIKASEDLVAASLEGTWRREHLMALEQGLEHCDFIDRQIGILERAVQDELEALARASDEESASTSDSPAGTPFSAPDSTEGTPSSAPRTAAESLNGAPAPLRGDPQGSPPPNRGPVPASTPASGSAPPRRTVLRTEFERGAHGWLKIFLGVDLTAIPTVGVETALLVAAEIGPDLTSSFPTREHFCSWLGLAPGTCISGDRQMRSKGRTPVNRVGQALKMAAVSARRSQTWIGARHRSLLARMEKGRAIKATAHSLARLIWTMMTEGQEYVEKGMEHHEAVRDRRKLVHLKRKAKSMGYDLTKLAA